jgi:hypothetical protein
MRSTRAKSLLIDFLLTSICLSHGNNPGDVVAAWRVGNDDYSTGEQAQSDQPFLSIIEAAIHEVTHGPVNTSSASAKSNPCLAKLFRFLLRPHSYLIS